MMEILYLKRFTLINYAVYLIPDEFFEPFVEFNGDLTVENVYSIRLLKIDPSNLRISKPLIFSSLLVLLFFAIPIDIFEKTLKSVVENRSFNIVNFKLSLFGSSGPECSEVTSFILVFTAMLNDVKYLRGSPVFIKAVGFIYCSL